MWIISSKLICRRYSISQLWEQPKSVPATSPLSVQTGIQTVWEWEGRADVEGHDTQIWALGWQLGT